MAQYKAAKLASDRQVFMQAFGNAISEYDIAAPTALLAIADTIDLIRVAGGTELHEVLTWGSDLCTSGTLAVSVGYRKCNTAGPTTDVADYFGSALTNFQAAVLQGAPTRYVFTPITFNEDVFITVTVTTAATGAAITNGTIKTLVRGQARGVK